MKGFGGAGHGFLRSAAGQRRRVGGWRICEKFASAESKEEKGQGKKGKAEARTRRC